MAVTMIIVFTLPRFYSVRAFTPGKKEADLSCFGGSRRARDNARPEVKKDVHLIEYCDKM